MRIVVQKVHKCKLYVEGKLKSEIGNGLLVFVGVDKTDDIACTEYLARKVAQMRLFKDENDKLNKSVLDLNGDVMVVSNFTLMAEIASGTRPSFSNGADFEKANELYLNLANEFSKNGIKNVQTGQFRSHMHLETALDGPFTIVMERKSKNEQTR